MLIQEIDLNHKTIYHKFPTWEEFHQEAINCVEKIMTNQEDETNFGFYSYLVYDKWKLNIYYNQPEVFFSKLYSGMASKFFLFKKRERLWSNIFEHLKLEMSKLIDIRTTEYIRDDRTKYLDANKINTGDFDRTITGNTFERGENREAQRITNTEKPYSTIDLLHADYGNISDRADWLSTEAKIDNGYIGIEKDKAGNIVYGEDGKPNKIINPNWNNRTGRSRNKDYSYKHDKSREDTKETDHGIIDKTITTQEQPVFYQQLARIMPSFSLVETNLDDLTDFSELFHSIYLPQGEFRWNTNTWQYEYITRQQLLEEVEPEKKKKREKPVKDPDQDISQDEWKELYQEHEKPVMPTWYLERVYRYKKRIEKKPNPDETDQARLELCETLLDTFYRTPYWPELAQFEEIMGSPPEFQGKVIGFKEFKSELRRRLKTSNRHRKRGTKPPQIFYVLLGKPGVGKSEIAQQLAKAFKRSIQIINVGGMDDGGELEGKRATLQSANYGKVMEAYVERSSLAEITIEDLQQEIKEIKTHWEKQGKKLVAIPRKEVTLTEWEEERIEKLEEEIREWQEDNQQRINDGKEPRKTKKKVMRSRVPIILLDEFEKASREDILNVIGKMTDRKLNYTFLDKYFNFNLDISEAIILLTANWLEKVPQFVKDRCKPVNIELLTYQQRKDILALQAKDYLAEYDMEDKINLFSERFLELLITETWGIRGGINNLMATIDFLDELDGDGLTDELEDLADYDEIEETEEADYIKRQEGVIRLIYHLDGEKRELVLTKRIGIEPRTIKDDDDREITVKEIITGKDIETGKSFVEDWPEEYWWGGKPIREV